MGAFLLGRAPDLAWLIAPLVAHLAFSWIGFNPTDDGWLQAVARRLADGEVPHRDFIFVRPALSAILQVPLVWWAGEHVIAMSRLWGWLTLGAVCWLWTGRVAAGTAPITRHALYLVSLALSAHTFPVMAWHSIDGLLLASLAVVMAARDTAGSRRVAFMLVGLAALCRQNFGLFAPWLMLAVGGPPGRWFSAAFWSLVPPLLYFAAMGVMGAGADFVHQITATGSGFLFLVGVQGFFTEPWFLSALAGGFALGWVQRRTSAAWPRWFAFLWCAGALAFALSQSPWWYRHASFALHGLVIGLGAAWAGALSKSDRLHVVAAAGLAWTVAISLGTNHPALATGVLILALWRLLQLSPVPAADRPPPRILLPLTAAVAVAALTFARHRFPYLDRPANELTSDAGTALRGAAGLRTNAVTQATLADLQTLTARLEAENRPHVILTDFAAVWIRSPRPNPLPCEWPQETELGYDRALFLRVFRALRDLPPEARVVVQKYLIADGGWQQTPMPAQTSYYFVQNWVSSHCSKRGETAYFVLYAPPSREAMKSP